MRGREIQLENGWVIKIKQGLDFYQKPLGWYEIGVHDLTQRWCLETKVNIFRGSGERRLCRLCLHASDFFAGAPPGSLGFVIETSSPATGVNPS